MKAKEFELREEHIKLLQAMYWEYSDCETGAPAADCKRPYGNSYVPPDVAKILGVELPDELAHDDDKKYDEKVAEIMRFHYETNTALQVILQTKGFEPGLYEDVGDRYKTKWKKVK